MDSPENMNTEKKAAPEAATDKASVGNEGAAKSPLSKKTIIISAAVAAVVIIAVVAGIVIASMGGKKDPKPVVLPSSAFTSPTALAVSEDGSFLYVADATGCAVYRVDASDYSVVGTYLTDVKVNDVALDGENIYVAEGELGGKLVKLDSDLEIVASVITGHTPSDICIEDGTAYVANRFSNTVTCVDTGTMKETDTIPVSREPIALTYASGSVYVGCHLSDDVANTSDTRAKVSVISTADKSSVKTIELCNGAGSVLGICASPDGATVYVTHIVAHYQAPTTQLDGGWINTNAVSVIDTAGEEEYYAFLLDDVELGAANPWGIVATDSYIYVALSGTNQVSRVDLKKLSTKMKGVKRGTLTYNGVKMTYADIVDNIAFTATCKTRLTLDNAGVRALAYHDGILYAGEYFAGSVEVIEEDKFTVIDTILIKEQPAGDSNLARLGELYWYDATSCYQMWQSCNSCHPDARADGFNWDNLNDGLGNAKQAKSMLYSYRTPPVMVTGIRPNAEVASAAGYKYISYNADNAQYLPAIDAYLKALAPVQSPYLNNDGTLTAAAENGKKLFEKYGCTECHPAPFYTDMKMHDSKDLDLDDTWENRQLDTPSLVEVWRTGPWTLNGYYNKMSDYMKFLIESKGETISDSDASDLAEYVLSIGDEGENYGVVQVYNEDTTYNKFVADSTITGLSVIMQKAGSKTAVVTATVYDASGKELGSASATVSDAVFGMTYEIKFDKALSTAGGAYYIISIKDESGAAYASDLKIG